MKTFVHKILIIVLLLLTSVVQAKADDSLSTDSQRQLLRDGLNAFDRAVELARQNADESRDLYQKAAAAFTALADAGVRNPALEYNLGNAYFRLGKPGRAIVHYRRGLRLDPTHTALNENLAYARNRVEPYIAPPATRQLRERLFFWTNRASAEARYRFTLWASVAGWAGLAVWLTYRSRPLLILSLLAIVFALANAGSVAWQLHEEAARPSAVIVDGRYTLRLGRGEGYDPALNQPLGPGVEVNILSERADWAEIQLADGKTGWLPSRALVRIE